MVSKNKKVKCSLCEEFYPKGKLRSFFRSDFWFKQKVVEGKFPKTVWIHAELKEKFGTDEWKSGRLGKPKLCRDCIERLELTDILL